jgi:hypothetical protein
MTIKNTDLCVLLYTKHTDSPGMYNMRKVQLILLS